MPTAKKKPITKQKQQKKYSKIQTSLLLFQTICLIISKLEGYKSKNLFVRYLYKRHACLKGTNFIRSSYRSICDRGLRIRIHDSLHCVKLHDASVLNGVIKTKYTSLCSRSSQDCQCEGTGRFSVDAVNKHGISKLLSSKAQTV